MKKLILFLCLVTGYAHAEIYFVGKNQSGKDIVLTLEKPSWCDGVSMMYTYTINNVALYGCWFYMQDKIHVKYLDGERRIYEVSGFEMRGQK